MDTKTNGWKNAINSACWHNVSQIITEQQNTTGLDQESANYSRGHLFLQIKFYWDTAVSMSLPIS